MDTDAKGDEQPKKTRKVKKQVRKGDLPIVAGTPAIEPSVKEAWIEGEKAMYLHDKTIAETDEKKNELETTIYDMRDRKYGRYARFLEDEAKKQAFDDKLDELEVCSLSFSSQIAVSVKVLCSC